MNEKQLITRTEARRRQRLVSHCDPAQAYEEFRTQRLWRPQTPLSLPSYGKHFSCGVSLIPKFFVVGEGTNHAQKAHALANPILRFHVHFTRRLDRG